MENIDVTHLEKIERMNTFRQELMERGEYFGEIHIILSGEEGKGSDGMVSHIESDVNGLLNGAKECIESISKHTGLPVELVVALVVSELKEEGE